MQSGVNTARDRMERLSVLVHGCAEPEHSRNLASVRLRTAFSLRALLFSTSAENEVRTKSSRFIKRGTIGGSSVSYL